VSPDQLRAAFEQNKTVILGGGLAAAVGLALYRKHNTGGQATPDAGAALSSGAQTAAMSGGAAYDSSASDLYGALQPQLEAIGQQLDQLTPHTSIPTPAPPAPAPVPHGDPRWRPGTPVTRIPVVRNPNRGPGQPRFIPKTPSRVLA